MYGSQPSVWKECKQETNPRVKKHWFITSQKSNSITSWIFYYSLGFRGCLEGSHKHTQKLGDATDAWSKGSGKSTQNYQPAHSLDRTAVLQSQFVPMYSLAIGVQWDPGTSLFSSDAPVVPVRRKTSLPGQPPCLFLVTTACCHLPLGFWSSDIPHLCAPADNSPLPCSHKGLCRYRLHLPLCGSCSEQFLLSAESFVF